MNDLLDKSMVEPPSFFTVAEQLSLGMTYQILASPNMRSGRFVHVGAACESLTGHTPQALLADGTLFAKLIAPPDLERLMAAKMEALAEERTCDVVVAMRGPDGAPKWRRIVSAPKRLADGGVLWTGLVSDVTEAIRTSRQLLAEQRRLQLAVEVVGMGVFQWDRSDPDNVVWSPRQYEIFGLPQETPITMGTWVQSTHPDDVQIVDAAYEAARAAPDGGDYSCEHRIFTPAGQLRWILVNGRVVRDARGVKTVHGAVLDTTERKLAEERRQLQMRELAHRGKNALSVIMAMVQQASRGAGSAAELAEVLMARLGAMSASQDLAMASGGRPVALSRLIAQVLSPFDLRRFAIDPAIAEVNLAGDVATGLALLLHELATNAVKYGALSTPVGKIAIAAEPAPGGAAVVTWRERGGPPATAPRRRGFGSRLAEAALAGVGGSVERKFAPEGFEARMSFPTS